MGKISSAEHTIALDARIISLIACLLVITFAGLGYNTSHQKGHCDVALHAVFISFLNIYELDDICMGSHNLSIIAYKPP
jgi:hypothetical protein